ncbi:MAG: hypothetical protein AAF587_14405 [Bacteroidota bacterium]
MPVWLKNILYSFSIFFILVLMAGAFFQEKDPPNPPAQDHTNNPKLEKSFLALKDSFEEFLKNSKNGDKELNERMIQRFDSLSINIASIRSQGDSLIETVVEQGKKNQTEFENQIDNFRSELMILNRIQSFELRGKPQITFLPCNVNNDKKTASKVKKATHWIVSVSLNQELTNEESIFIDLMACQDEWTQIDLDGYRLINEDFIEEYPCLTNRNVQTFDYSYLLTIPSDYGALTEKDFFLRISLQHEELADQATNLNEVFCDNKGDIKPKAPKCGRPAIAQKQIFQTENSD